MWGPCSDLHTVNLGDVLDILLMKMGTPRTEVPGISHFHTRAHPAYRNVSQCPFSFLSLYGSSNFGPRCHLLLPGFTQIPTFSPDAGCCLHCDLSSQVGSKKPLVFSLFSFFLLVGTGVITSKLVICQSRNQKSC